MVVQKYTLKIFCFYFAYNFRIYSFFHFTLYIKKYPINFLIKREKKSSDASEQSFQITEVKFITMFKFIGDITACREIKFCGDIFIIVVDPFKTHN